MKRILVPTLIALTVSSVALAQQATEELENKVDNMAQNAENAVENAAEKTEAAAENLALEADAMDPDRTMLRRPVNMGRAGYVDADPAELTAETLTGSRVYSVNDEDIGEVDELLLSEDGSAVDKVVVDVGGFLGMGEREVAVTMEEVHIMRAEDGTDFRVYIDATQEELEAQPEYDG